MLGVTLDDLYKDWRVTDFSGGALYKEHVEERFDKTLVASAESFPGDNLQQKLENYLLSIGITAAEIQKFREIMLEKSQTESRMQSVLRLNNSNKKQVILVSSSKESI